MHPKLKNRATDAKGTTNAVKPPLLHDVTNPSASANAAARLRMNPVEPASGPANHARHHVSTGEQG